MCFHVFHSQNKIYHEDNGINAVRNTLLFVQDNSYVTGFLFKGAREMYSRREKKEKKYSWYAPISWVLGHFQTNFTIGRFVLSVMLFPFT